jgi:phosphate/sulfate permease
MVNDLILGLGVVLAFVFGWNNSSFLIGSGKGSGSLTLHEALIVSSAGLLLGVVFEGSKMLKSLSGITPVATDSVVLVALAVSLGMTVVLSIVKLPVSFSMAVVGAFAGAAYGSFLPLNGVWLRDVVTFWFLSPIFAAVLAFVFYKAIVRSVSRLSLLALDGASRYAVIITSLVIAYVLGANNIGLIYGTTLSGTTASEPLLLSMVVLAVAGMVALGRGGISGTIGDRLLVLSPLGVVATFLSSAVLIGVGTQLSIPISISQCLMGGMFGAAFTKQASVVNTRLAAESMASWVAVPVGAFLLAFVLVLL